MRVRGAGSGRPWGRTSVGALAAGFLLACSMTLAQYPFSFTGHIRRASAHHTGDSDTLVLVEGTQQGYHVILEVAPRDPAAGSEAEFSLWTYRITPGSPYTGRVRLSTQVEGGSAGVATEIPIPEKGEGGVSDLYRGTHRFEHEGSYRFDLELTDLPARWAGTFRASPTAPWYTAHLQFVSVISLVVGGAFLFKLLLAAGAKRTRRGLPWPGSGQS